MGNQCMSSKQTNSTRPSTPTAKVVQKNQEYTSQIGNSKHRS